MEQTDPPGKSTPRNNQVERLVFQAILDIGQADADSDLAKTFVSQNHSQGFARHRIVFNEENVNGAEFEAAQNIGSVLSRVGQGQPHPLNIRDRNLFTVSGFSRSFTSIPAILSFPFVPEIQRWRMPVPRFPHRGR